MERDADFVFHLAGGVDLRLNVKALPVFTGTLLAAVRVVGFARHTEVGLIRAARAAGCTQVLTQGEFTEALEGLLRHG